MTDFSEARIVKCRRCGVRFVPEDGGCDCLDVEINEDGEEVLCLPEDDWREDR